MIVLVSIIFGMGSNTAYCQVPDEAIAFGERWGEQRGERREAKGEMDGIGESGLSGVYRMPGDDGLFVAEYGSAGFVIFFLTDGEADVVGFSDDFPFPDDSHHPLLSYWIPLAQPGLTSGRLKSVKGISLMQDAKVEPLIQSKWGQGEPWNQFCPEADGQRALVGCVAVALGQVMKKWNWPERGLGSNAYTPTNHPEYGQLEVSFDTTYQWAEMDPVLPAEATSLLLYHIGVATFMNYGPNESGANTAMYASQALIDHFAYNPSIQLRQRDRFSENDWHKMLRQELINGRPVVYRGVDPDNGAGHAFNVDGFHSNDYFHFNWGWDGTGNGYFRIENMGAGGGNFTNGQAALFWIQPNSLPMHDRPASAEALPGDGFVQLMWEDLTINDFSHFNIYRDGELIGSTWENRYRDETVVNRSTYQYYITANYIGESPGESIPTDSLAVTPWEQITLPLQSDFESSPAGWEMKRAIDGFQWGRAADLGVPGNNGHLIAIRSDQAESDQQVRDYVISPTLDIRGMDHVGIKFDYVFKQKPLTDYLFLMYRRYDNGLWYPVTQLDATGDWTDWKTVYYYLPDEAKNTLIQLGFYYNDFNGQGYGAAIDNIEVWQINDPPVPGFKVNTSESCAESILVFTSESSGPITNWFWDFGQGASPRYGMDEGPHEVIYESEGVKTVSLLLNHLDYTQKTDLLYIQAKPISGFDYQTRGLLVEFQDTSQNGSWYFWDFGDGRTSTEQNPENKYHEFKNFEVMQVVYNELCSPDTTLLQLDFSTGTGLHKQEQNNWLVYPNPVSDQLWIDLNGDSGSSFNWEILTLQGRCLRRQHLHPSGRESISLSDFAPGIYILHINNPNQQRTFRICKL